MKQETRHDPFFLFFIRSLINSTTLTIRMLFVLLSCLPRPKCPLTSSHGTTHSQILRDLLCYFSGHDLKVRDPRVGSWYGSVGTVEQSHTESEQSTFYFNLLRNKLSVPIILSVYSPDTCPKSLISCDSLLLIFYLNTVTPVTVLPTL